MVMELCRVFVGNIATACINFLMSTYTKFQVDAQIDASVLKVVAALITLSFQRRDQRRAAMSESRTPSDIRGSDHANESIKNIEMEKQAEKVDP